MGYRAWVSLLCLVLVKVASSQKPSSLRLHEKYPPNDESQVCGRIRDVIPRDSGRFRKILIRNTNNQAYYANDDCRRMTSRTKSKLDILASRVIAERGWADPIRVRVLRAWTDQVEQSDKTSLHYEGRSVRLQLSDRDRNKLGRLAGLAIEAGFDWVEYTNPDYIRASVIPDVCQTSVDLVFLLDGSGSVGWNNFKKVKDFVKKVVDFFNIGVFGTHIAVVTYETSTHIEFGFRSYYTKSDLRKAVDHVPYRDGWTYTGEALDILKRDVFTPSAGMRTDPGIPKVLVLLTDGHSNGKGVYAPANALRNVGVNIFSIGVGRSVSKSQLKEIASDPDDAYVFLLDNFNDLSGWVDRLSSVSCSEGALIKSCDEAVTTVTSGSFKYFRTQFDSVTGNQVSVEVRDQEGVSHLYASATSKNPGPLDPDSVKNENDRSPRAVSVQLQPSKTIFVAVQGQRDTNKFILSFWDNLFSHSTFQASINEGLPAQSVKTLTLASHGYSLVYRISDGNVGGAFLIDRHTPKINTTKTLDRERVARYDLVVVAEDTANKCRKSRTLVQVSVIDVNDNAPKFSEDPYRGDILENAEAGTLVKTVKATDEDAGVNGQITYNIVSGNTGNLFRIDSHGRVTLQGKLDFETNERYTLRLVARDGGNPSQQDAADLQITVVNVNERPSIKCETSCTMSVSENAGAGVKVGKVSATDPDRQANCALRYDISSSVKDKFQVLTDGEIHTKTSLNRELSPQYVFHVTVRDCGLPTLTDSVRLTVNVRDVNDNRPSFPGPYTVSMLESEAKGSTVLQVKASDADEGVNAQTRYSLSGADSTVFSINAGSGRITTRSALDYEAKQSYRFSVTATDRGSGPLAGSTSVTVNVVDVNDNAPVFTGAPYSAQVLEGSLRGTEVTTVRATDMDSGSNGQVRYSIVSGNHGSAFTINAGSGLITVNSNLDRETRSSYSMLVQAADRGSPSMSSRATLTVTIGDKNDNSPVFHGLPYMKAVSENLAVNKLILKVFATDRDAGAFGKVSYSVDSPANDTFSVDSSGNIRLKKKLDYETKKDYSVKVVAVDGGRRSAEATVSVSVEDYNDNTPRFDRNPYTAAVAENVDVGHVVKSVNAVDKDSGPRGRVTYSITSGNVGNAFTISASGNVAVASNLDRESRDSYSLIIQAKDEGTPSLSSTSRLDITVTDINDNKPRFGKDSYSFSIPENNSPDAEVGNPGPASDADKGVNAEIEYSIVSGDPNQAFEFEPSGKLIAKKVLDREVVPSYSLVLEAKDKGSPAQFARVHIWVTVLDQNDNPPVFSPNSYSCTISENSAGNSPVCFVRASDKDVGNNGAVTYELVESNFRFSVDQNTGEIKTKVTLDREKQSSYSFDVRAKDGGSQMQSATVSVTVQVIDKNDNEPVFNQSSYVFDVSEDAVVTTAVGSVLAQDKDEGSNGQVVYSIASGNTKNAFAINANSGSITVKSRLDRETLARYSLTVQAADLGSPVLFSKRVVKINVKDVNDNDPIFTQTLYRGLIAEDASIGSAVVHVKATDADEGVNGRIKYSITGGEHKEHFNIHPDTGVITTARLLDYEVKKSYLLDLRATDGGNPRRSATCRVNIAIKNTNDNAPTFVPGSPTVSVSEGVATGTEVVKFNATDKDGNVLKFSISSGNTDGALKINRNTGVLTTGKKLDRETVPRYNLTVTVTDNGGQSSSRNLSVIVLDENDNAPIFKPSAYKVNVTENSPTGPVITVTAKDNDQGKNAEISFSIDSASATKFFIDRTTGEISTKKPLDHEESPRYVIQVIAKDAGRPSLSSVATVEVTVVDMNDNNPNFKGDYRASLLENTAKGRKILRVEATDPDSGINGEIQYSITKGNEKGFFSLDSNDGSITVQKPPDREADPSFTLTILAQNKVPSTGSAPSTNTSTTVTITIEDVNDNAPEITNDVDTVQLQENSKQSAQVFDVNATDRDTGVNSQIKYEIVSGNVNNAFAIDSGSGVVTVKGAIDRETLDMYSLRIRASDKGTPSLSSQKEFTVNVTDIDDNAPVFSAKSYDASVTEDANVSTGVIKVQATDQDITGEITYSITTGNGLNHFKIDPATGEVLTNALLDYENVSAYSLVVRAQDTRHAAQANLRISLININDNDPVFSPPRYTVNITEDADLDKAFLTLKATDEDPFSGLSFSIIDGNLESKFALHPRNGELSVASDLDRETRDLYKLNVRVTDGGVPARSGSGSVEVRVTDVNDNSPKFNSSLEQVSVKENSPVGEEVFVAYATDRDLGVNSELRYAITSGNEEQLFQLDRITGVLSVAGNIDREKISSFVLEVVARDRGSPSLTSETLRVEIQVLDENDNGPVFRQNIYRQNITENLSAGTFVKEIEATDEDLGRNGQVVYSIKSGHSSHFTIQRETGIVQTSAPLNRENISLYTIIIEAQDLGNRSRSSTATLLVNVLDANDDSPLFVLSSLRANVTEEKPRGQFVTRVVSTDNDLGSNADVEYKLTLRGEQYLKIDPKTGIVTTLVKFDYEQQKNHSFKVTAADKGNPSLSTTGELVINVIDIDDNCPDFNPKEYNITIPENKPLDELIVRVFATDVDTVNARDLDYGIRSGNLESTFNIDPKTGEIKSNKFVDREVSSEFNLVVRAGSDYCGVSETEDEDESNVVVLSKSIARVNVFVTDVNDNAPVFFPSTYDHEFHDISASSLLWVNATDPDEGVNAEVDFALDSVKRVQSKRTLIVIAKDRGVPSLSSNTTIDVTGVTCEAMRFDVSLRGHVTVKTLCIFDRVEINGNPLVGESIKLDCGARGNTVPEYRWTRNSVPFSEWSKTGEHHITSLTKDDTGEYACIASSEAGNILSRSIKLNVKEPATIATHPKDTWAGIGEKATLSCLANGDEPISYTWYKDNRILLSSGDLITDRADLVFNKVIPEDDAEYFCKAKNDVSSKAVESRTARFQVYTPDSVVEIDLTVDKPREGSCQFFNMTSFKETLEEITKGKAVIVEFTKPKKMCNITACSSAPCQNGAQCVDTDSGFMCQCPRGRSGRLCQKDVDECRTESCKNNGTCVNQEGSFSCQCLNGSYGKLCELTDAVCKPNRCNSGEQCYPKGIASGYECVGSATTVDMVFKLQASRRPWKDWMKYDVAKDIENAIASKKDPLDGKKSKGTQRRRRASPPDYGTCSVRVLDLTPSETEARVHIVLVCATPPSKTYVCQAVLAEGHVSSCTGDKGVMKEPTPTQPPPIDPISFKVAFLMRDSSGKETEGSTTVTDLREGNIEGKLEQYSVTVNDLRARSPKIAKADTSSFSSGAIAGVVVGVCALVALAISIALLVLRSKRRTGKDFSIGGRAILSRTQSTDMMEKRDISMQELKTSDARGVHNKTFSEIYEENEGNPTDLEDGAFLIENSQLALKKQDKEYMTELESAPWFHGSVLRSKAEDILDSSDNEGSFIVRAGLDRGEFYISFRSSGDGPKYRHIPVYRRDDSFVAVCGSESETKAFPTFHEIIAYLRFNPMHFEGAGADLTLTEYVEKKGTTEN